MPARWQQWMPFHIDRFRGSPDVQAMHPVARIGYLYLLASAWQTDDCTISSDSLDLASLSGLGDELWAQYSPRIMRKFEAVDETGRLRNAVLFQEWKEAKRIFEARRNAAERTTQIRSPRKNATVTVKKTAGDCTVTDGEPSRSLDTITGTSTNTFTQELKDICSEASSEPAMLDGKPLTLSMLGGPWPVPAASCVQWAAAYPGINVLTELLRAAAWLEANPKNRKTRKGAARFVVNWLSRAQDRARPEGVENGKNHASPAKQRVDDNRRAIAEALAKRGVRGPWDHPQPHGEAVSQPGSEGLDGRVPERPRAASPEVLPPAV